jgi:hypothetical protein
MMLAGWGIAWLRPLVSVMFDSQRAVRLQGMWFDCAMAVTLVAAGTMLTTKKGVPVALTLLIPLSVHVLFRWVLFSH